jgi:hypothetical protein
MDFKIGKLVHYLLRKARLVRSENGPVIELDLRTPVMVPNVCLVRALIDRMIPGQQIIFRSRDLEMPWEMEHFCNHLGHELLEVGREGTTYFFTLRVRGNQDRLPKQDPYSLDLTPPNPITTIDITPNREPWRIGRKSAKISGAPPQLKDKTG